MTLLTRFLRACFRLHFPVSYMRGSWYATINGKPVSPEEWDRVAKPYFDEMERQFDAMERALKASEREGQG